MGNLSNKNNARVYLFPKTKSKHPIATLLAVDDCFAFFSVRSYTHYNISIVKREGFCDWDIPNGETVVNAELEKTGDDTNKLCELFKQKLEKVWDE